MITKRQSVRMTLSVVLIAASLLVTSGMQTASARGNVSAVAATWYVATTGNDANACSTVGAPCLTIDGAINKAAAADTIDVAAGTYTGSSGVIVTILKDITLLGGWDGTFSSQSGVSTIDGQTARAGVYINDGLVVAMDRFVIQNGSGGQGAGIYTRGTLTLTNSVISNNASTGMGGGIDFFGNYGAYTLTLTNTTVSSNSAVSGGGGIYMYSGNMVLNDATLNGNAGGAIQGFGTATLNNSTVSGNTGTYAIGLSMTGTLTLNNVTVTGNTGGITGDAAMWMRNSILADNNRPGSPLGNCYATIGSAGYNLVDVQNSACTFNATTGDQVGTPTAPIYARLLPLADNGGPTFTHALAGNSPALNAGNPATPGSGGDACLATDQRGVARPVDSACDIGAFEGHYATVSSINRASSNPTSAATVAFTVTFSEAVTGVDITDLALTAAGVVSPSITSVAGSGATYTVTVNTGSGNGTIRLDLVDDDTILDGSSNPLGGSGTGNADFTTGQAYTVSKFPVPQAPLGQIWDTTPTYKWTRVPLAAQYRYQLLKGTTIVYTRTVLASACAGTACANTPATFLAPGTYKWHVQALAGGVWKAYSPFKSFTLYAPMAGYWSGSSNDLSVPASRVQVAGFTIYVSVAGCGKYKIRHALVNINSKNGTFAFTGPFYASGAFIKSSVSPTRASGSAGLNKFLIAGCGYVSGGPFAWSAIWRSTKPPDLSSLGDAYLPATVTPVLEAPFDFLLLGPSDFQP